MAVVHQRVVGAEVTLLDSAVAVADTVAVALTNLNGRVRAWRHRHCPARNDPAGTIALVKRLIRDVIAEEPNSRERHRALVQALAYSGDLDRAYQVASAWLERDRLDRRAFDLSIIALLCVAIVALSIRTFV